MTSYNFHSNIQNEFGTFYSSYRTDDTLIDIIPAFDYYPNHPSNSSNSNSNNNNNSNISFNESNDMMIGTIFQSTLSTTNIATIHGIKAGIPISVPLWMALLLQQRSFATIVLPNWYTSINNLKYILEYEKNNTSIFHTTSSSTTSSSSSISSNATSGRRKSRRWNQHQNDNDDNDDDDNYSNDNDNDNDDTSITQNNNNNSIESTYYLPSNYYELAMRLKSTGSSSSSALSNNNNNNNSNDDDESVDDYHHRNRTTTTNTQIHINHDVISLFIQDIYIIRCNKLQLQFQTLLHDMTRNSSSSSGGGNNNKMISSDTTTNPTIDTDVIINVTGIGTMEHCMIQSYVLHAMNDLYYLSSSSSSLTNSNPSGISATITN